MEKEHNRLCCTSSITVRKRDENFQVGSDKKLQRGPIRAKDLPMVVFPMRNTLQTIAKYLAIEEKNPSQCGSCFIFRPFL